MSYEPYKLENWKELVKWAYNQAWYGGKVELLRLAVVGGFEAFSGKASECWEQQFQLTVINPANNNNNSFKGETIDEVSLQALRWLESQKEVNDTKDS